MIPAVIALHAVTVDLEGRWVDRGDGRIRLTSRECELLRYLADHADRTVPREELLQRVWGHDASVISRACDNAVRRVRLKIEADPANPESLLTRHGSGYRLVLHDPDHPAAPPEPAPARKTRRIALGPWTADLDLARLQRDDEAIALTANEVALITALWEAGGAPIDRDVLKRRVWGSAAGRPLVNTVSRLRRKLEEDPTAPRLLLTTAHGYRLALDPPTPQPQPQPQPQSPLPSSSPTPPPPPPPPPTTPSTPPPTATAPSNLPDPIDAQFGRTPEIAAIVATAATAATARLITLSGPGGVGKTRLALAAATTLAGSDRSAWFVDLTAATDPNDVCAAIAATLRVPLGEDDGPSQIGRALAARGRTVVVLDNLEQLSSAAVAAVGTIAGCATDAIVLCTSRTALRLRGERQIEVEPLPIRDAIALFCDRAIRPPGEDEADAVRQLVADLEGLPLAIELAAARTRTLSLAKMQQRLADRLALLVGGGPDAPPRQRSLAASLEVSWGLLSPWAQGALAQLSVFAGRVDVEAAEAVCDLRRWPDAPPTIDVLEELVDASLLRVAPDGEDLAMLRAVAAFAASKRDDDDPAALRHAAYHAERFGPTALAALDGPGEIALRQALGGALDNLKAAARTAIDRGRGDLAAALCEAIWEAMSLSGPFSAVIALAKAAATTAASRSPHDRARALLTSGLARSAAGEWEDAIADLQTARSLAREQRSPETEGRAEIALAELHTERGDLDAAMAAATRAEAIATRTADRALACRALDALAAIHLERWFTDQALACAQSAVSLAQSLGARRLTALARTRLGRIWAELDAPDSAAHELDRALDDARALGDANLEARVLIEQGSMARFAGGLAASAATLRSAVALHQRTGDRRGEAVALVQLGSTLATDRLVAEATDLLERANATAADLAAPSLQCRAMLALANAHAIAGRAAAADRLYGEALLLSRTLHDPRVEGTILANLARLKRNAGELAVAIGLLEAALTIHQATGNRRSMAITMTHLADLLAQQDKLQDAITTYEGAIALHRAAGSARFEAIALHNLGRTHLLAADADAAVRCLDEAHARLAALDEAGWLGQVELTRAEVSLARDDRDGAAAALARADQIAPQAHLEPRRSAIAAAIAGEAPYEQPIRKPQ